ncbi:MAG TPA: LLM class flavin-dependent oxidoreductase [Chloroflexota bacterium]
MSGTIRFGIALQTNKTPDEYVAQARLIDQYAFDVVSVYNDLFFQPALGPLVVMAPHLHRAQVGPAALNPYTLHPVEIAGQIAFLDRLTGGRAYLGLARGSWLERLGVPQPRPVQTLREAALLVGCLLGGNTAGFEGRVFHLDAGSSLQYAPLRSSVPLTIGTWGGQTARMAGEIADEIKIGGSANAAMGESLGAYVRAGEARAGRPPGSVGICLGAVTVVAEDRASARRAARSEVALYAPVVARFDPSLGDPGWLSRIAEAARRGDYATVADLIPDSVLDRLAFAGTPADVVRQVEDLASAGITRVEFGTPHGLDSLDGIRLLGERVLPSFSI